MKYLLTLTIVFTVCLFSAANVNAATIARVINGSTFELTNRKIVHLIGVETPKIVYPEGVDRVLFDPSAEAIEQVQRWEVSLDELDRMGRASKKFVRQLFEERKVKSVQVVHDISKKDKDKK